MMWEYLKQLFIMILVELDSLLLSQPMYAQGMIQIPEAQYKVLMQNSITSRDSLKQANSLTQSLQLRISDMQTMNEGIKTSVTTLENINKELNMSWSLDRKRLEESSAINVEQFTHLTIASESLKKLGEQVGSLQNELFVWKVVGISGATLGVVALIKLGIDFLK